MNQPYAPIPTVVRTSNLAIISLVSGIVSWVFLPLIAAIIAIITGHMAKNEIKRGNGLISGSGMATAGLILGYVQLGLGICACLVIAVMLALGMTIPFINNSVY
jgi:uncharacterized membrane protein YjfL (UPF0719 family)